MKISIITVCQNSVRVIEKALSSVHEQDYKNIEHIVIDGGSTDGTLKKIMIHRHKLAHLVSEPDDGIYDAMNKGIDLASGDVICFLNADDYYASPYILSLVAERMANDCLDAFYGDVVFFSEKTPQKIIRRYRSDKFKPELIPYGWMPAHPALFLHRSIFETFGNFDATYQIAGDFEFIARAFYRGGLRCGCVPEILVCMQAGGASNGGWRSKLLLNREVLRACKANAVPSGWLKLLSKYPAKLMEYFDK